MSCVSGFSLFLDREPETSEELAARQMGIIAIELRIRNSRLLALWFRIPKLPFSVDRVHLRRNFVLSLGEAWPELPDDPTPLDRPNDGELCPLLRFIEGVESERTLPLFP